MCVLDVQVSTCGVLESAEPCVGSVPLSPVLERARTGQVPVRLQSSVSSNPSRPPQINKQRENA